MPSNSTSQLLALSTALEHAGFSTDPHLLCAAAQTCKALRQAVQQRSVSNTVVVLGPSAPLHQLRSFASWLTGHAHLVSSITADKQPEKGTSELNRSIEDQADTIKAQQLLAQALQLAAGPAATAAAATRVLVGDTAAAPQQQQQGRLRLASFCSNYADLAVLKSLPMHSLEQLQINTDHLPAKGAEIAGLLANFSNLQQLQLDSTENVPGGYLAGIAQLSKLTQLMLTGCSANDLQEPLQQLLAQPPPLQQLQLPLHHADVLDMTALTHLEELVTDQLHPVSKLPCQLRSLKLTAVHEPGVFMPLSALQQLHRLDMRVNVDSEATEQVLQLAQRLPTLTHLALTYTYAWDAALAGPSWQKLPQLRELSLDFEHGMCAHRWQINDILAGVAAATSLTKLELEAFCAVGNDDDESEEEEESAEYECAPVAVCRSLSQLTRLQDLCISQYSMLRAGDASALTALTNLTRLVLYNMRDGVGDAGAAAIASNLTQLRHLDLRWCNVGRSGADLAEFQQLVQLTELRLEGNRQLSRNALRNVLDLPRLAKVGLDSLCWDC